MKQTSRLLVFACALLTGAATWSCGSLFGSESDGPPEASGGGNDVGNSNQVGTPAPGDDNKAMANGNNTTAGNNNTANGNGTAGGNGNTLGNGNTTGNGNTAGNGNMVGNTNMVANANNAGSGNKPVTDSMGCVAATVRYTGTIDTMLQSFCLGCHGNRRPMMNNYANAVTAFKTGGAKVSIDNKSMPKGRTLTQAQICQFNNWVTSGYLQ